MSDDILKQAVIMNEKYINMQVCESSLNEMRMKCDKCSCDLLDAKAAYQREQKIFSDMLSKMPPTKKDK